MVCVRYPEIHGDGARERMSPQSRTMLNNETTRYRSVEWFSRQGKWIHIHMSRIVKDCQGVSSKRVCMITGKASPDVGKVSNPFLANGAIRQDKVWVSCINANGRPFRSSTWYRRYPSSKRQRIRNRTGAARSHHLGELEGMTWQSPSTCFQESLEKKAWVSSCCFPVYVHFTLWDLFPFVLDCHHMFEMSVHLNWFASEANDPDSDMAFAFRSCRWSVSHQTRQRKPPAMQPIMTKSNAKGRAEKCRCIHSRCKLKFDATI